MRLKFIFLVALCLLFTNLYFSQNFTGGITPGAKLDTVFDRFGNKYSLKDIAVDTTSYERGGPIKKTTQLCANAGYFDLYFEAGSGMEGAGSPDVDRRNVICQVFSDVSAFIGSPLNSTGNRVKIWVRDINQVVGNSNGVLGLATSFYSAPSNNTSGFGGIVDNEIWKTIHTGVDSYSNTCSPLMSLGGPNSSSATFFHGMMAFNFTTSINWQTVLTTPTITAGNFDLYSVALHEITHALGFASLINYNGTSKFGPGYNYYSRYDLFLKKGAANLITNSGACNSMYDYQFNSSLSTTVVAPGCTVVPTPTISGSSDLTTCSLSITYSGSSNVPVYTPTCFEPPSSLSHFEDICQVPPGFSTTCTATPTNNNLYYVMSNANGVGDCFMKRYLKPEERLVLCDLGYSVTTTYGSTGNHTYATYTTGVCSGITVAGINDGITSSGAYNFLTTPSVTVAITGILANDMNASTFECLQDVYTPSSYLSTTSGNSSTSITFSSTVTGLHLLRYVPVSASGQKGNITYIYVYITTASCTPSSCNIMNNGGFEMATNCGALNNVVNCPGSPVPNIDCWYPLSGTPDLFVRGCVNTMCGGSSMTIPTPYCSPTADTWNTPTIGLTNNNIIGLFSNNQWLPTTTLNESIQGTLSSPLQPNNTYILSFVARVVNAMPNVQNLPGAIEFGGSNGLLAQIGFFFNSLPSSLTSLAQVSVPNNNQWNYYSIPISYTAAVNLNFLSVVNAGYLNGNPVNTINYVLVDDISIQPTSQAVSLNLPASVACSTVTISNLNSYLTPTVTGGVFSGPGVSGSIGNYSFSSSLAGLGTHNIAFTYTNGSGCQITVADAITVTNASTISITAGSTNSITCSGAIATLTANGATTYTWNPGNLSGNTVTVSPSTNTTYTVSGSVCSSTAQAIITVSVISNPTITAVSNPTLICSSKTSSLTVSGASTYSWSTGATTTLTAVSPTTTTIYTVVGTATTGCSSTKTVAVNVVPFAPVITASATAVAICSGGAATVTASGASTYTWNTGATTSVITVTPSVPTVYTVSGNYSLTGCGTGSTTIVVNPVISTLCCSAPNSSITTSTITPGAYTAATVIDISGVITFTGNTSFTGYTFRMKPNAKLMVVGEYSLTLTNCKLYSCSELWDGIYLIAWNNDVHGHLVLNNTTVEDMYNGIVVEGNNYPVVLPYTGLLINSTASTLNKNYISMQFRNIDGTVVGPSLTYTTTPYPFSMKTTTISSYSSTTSPGSSLKPSSTYTYAYKTWAGGATSSTNPPFLNFPRTFKGIVLNNMRALAPLVIGDSTTAGSTNLFDNMDFGIHGTEASAKVHNNYFKNITGSTKQTANGESFPAFGPDEIGIAVAMTHTSTNVHALTVGTHTVIPSSNPYPKGNRFEDCNRGVYAIGCANVYAKANTFSATATSTVPPYGVDAYYYYKNQSAIWINAQADYFTLSYNYIQNFSSGIYSSHTTTNTSMRPHIFKNIIGAPSSTGFCKQAIQVAKVGGSNFISGYVNIDGNAIANVYNGIQAGGIANGVWVKNNSVSVEPTTKSLAITATTIRTAIRVSNSNYAIIQANSVTNGGAVPTTSTTANYITGIHVSGSTNTKVECNNAYHTGRGFVFEGACGNSSWKVNAMSDSYRGLEMRLAAVIGNQGAPTYTGTPNLSANTWTTLTQHTFVLGTTNVNTASKLYLLAGGNTQPTLNFAVSPSPSYTTGALNGIQTATGTSYTCNAGNAQRLANSDNVGNTNSGGNNQKTAGADSLTELTNLATADEDSYEVFADEMMYQNQQFVYQLIEQDSINPAKKSALSSFYNSTQNTAIDKLTEAQIAIANFDISGAYSANSSAPVLSAIEQKQQRANELVLKYMNDRNYVFTDAEKSELKNMANECEVKGDYVTHARNLVDVFTHATILYDDECETEANASRKKKPEVIVNNNALFNLFPNPNNGTMQLDYKLGSYSNAKFSLFDITGKLLQSINIQTNEGSLNINEQNLRNGVYFYTILVGEKNIKTDKIVIIK
jgi:hypothetical protein